MRITPSPSHGGAACYPPQRIGSGWFFFLQAEFAGRDTSSAGRLSLPLAGGRLLTKSLKDSTVKPLPPRRGKVGMGVCARRGGSSGMPGVARQLRTHSQSHTSYFFCAPHAAGWLAREPGSRAINSCRMENICYFIDKKQQINQNLLKNGGFQGALKPKFPVAV